MSEHMEILYFWVFVRPLMGVHSDFARTNHEVVDSIPTFCGSRGARDGRRSRARGGVIMNDDQAKKIKTDDDASLIFFIYFTCRACLPFG